MIPVHVAHAWPTPPLLIVLADVIKARIASGAVTRSARTITGSGSTAFVCKHLPPLLSWTCPRSLGAVRHRIVEAPLDGLLMPLTRQQRLGVCLVTPDKEMLVNPSLLGTMPQLC